MGGARKRFETEGGLQRWDDGQSTRPARLAGTAWMTLLKLWGELMVCLPCWRVGLASFWALLAFSVALLEPASQGVFRSQLSVQASQTPGQAQGPSGSGAEMSLG